MKNVDQRGFDNPPSPYVSAPDAARFLGIKLETLYAYASRGLVSSVRGPRGRPKQYARDDLLRLQARHDARAGHGAVAASALRWGEPVLESALTEITPAGPRYRGRLAADFVTEGARFEAVADHLWNGEPGSRWGVTTLGVPVRALTSLRGAHPTPVGALSLAVPALGASDPGRYTTDPEQVLGRARVLIRRMAASLALALAPERIAEALACDSVAEVLAVALGARRRRSDAMAAIDRALILCADHELNVSSFAARVAASAGADLYACVAAALATLTGPRHGGVCDRIEAWIATIPTPAHASASLHDRARRGEDVPGFGHRLYPNGDPRAVPMLELAARLAPKDRRLAVMEAVVRAADRAGFGAPAVDTGLVAVAFALGLPPGGAVALFAIGRTAGWVAHAMEQHTGGYLLRPRARYVGVGADATRAR